MDTCGIEAGAKTVLDAFINEVDSKGLGGQVTIRQVGCMGKCGDEPTVEVLVQGMPTVIYGKVTPALVKDIVQTHLIDKKVLDKLVVEQQ